MLARRLRIVPDSALASLLSSTAANTILSPSRLMETRGSTACFNVPSGPFTVISDAERFTSTLSGTLTGYFAIRDMPIPLHHDAQNFAAHARLAGTAVGHDAARGRNDRHAQ